MSSVFDQNAERYEGWFDTHVWAYRSELQAVRRFLSAPGEAVEIGAGTGRFAAPCGIRWGLEPSPVMAGFARRRGVQVIAGRAEDMPFCDASFETVLLVTTLCFLDNTRKAFQETARILKPGGACVIGFVDRESQIGRTYAAHKDKSLFYRDAAFYSTSEVSRLLSDLGFYDLKYVQTLFHPLSDISGLEPVKTGYGEGSFIVVRAVSVS